MFRKLSIVLLFASCFVAPVFAVKKKKRASQKQKTVKLEARKVASAGVPAFALDGEDCALRTRPPSPEPSLYQQVLRRTLHESLADRAGRSRAHRHRGRLKREDGALKAALTLFAEMERCDMQEALGDMQRELAQFSFGAGQSSGAKEDRAADG